MSKIPLYHHLPLIAIKFLKTFKKRVVKLYGFIYNLSIITVKVK